jgi:hypothetical protein
VTGGFFLSILEGETLAKTIHFLPKTRLVHHLSAFYPDGKDIE